MSKTTPMTQRLAKLFGGKWTYDRHCRATWYCDDGIGTCCRVHSGSRDMNGELLDDDPGQLWVYGYGNPKLLIGDTVL